MTKERDDRTNRRDFGKALAAIAATPAVLIADETPAKPRPAEPTASVPDALLEVVRIRFGKQLSPEQLEAVKRSLNRQQFLANRMKQFKVKNGDEPAFVFSAEVP
jgi:hypothetical protein